MGYCAKHQQSYCEQMGGYCPYCGVPQPYKIKTTTGIEIEGGAQLKNGQDYKSPKTTAGDE